MISSITTFNLAEKLAIVKDIDRLILADGKVAEGEMIYLGQLMKLLNFDSNFVEEARKFNFKQAHSILKNLSEPKKHSLAIILHEMAYADGEMDRKELKMLFTAFEKIGVKIEKPGNSLSIFDISDIYFKSSRQRIQHKNKGTVEIISENKAVRIEPHIEGKKGYSVTTFNSNGRNFFWGKKVEMSSKQMEVAEVNSENIVLKGYDDLSRAGRDKHSNFSLTIFHDAIEVKRVVIHHLKEKIDIEYLQ